MLSTAMIFLVEIVGKSYIQKTVIFFVGMVGLSMLSNMLICLMDYCVHKLDGGKHKMFVNKD